MDHTIKRTVVTSIITSWPHRWATDAKIQTREPDQGHITNAKHPNLRLCMNITVALVKTNTICLEGNDQVSDAGIKRSKFSTENGRSLHTSGFRMMSMIMYATATETATDTPHLRHPGSGSSGIQDEPHQPRRGAVCDFNHNLVRVDP